MQPCVERSSECCLTYVSGPNQLPFLVAHNGMRFDIVVLREELRRFGMELPKHWHYVDSLRIARELHPNGENSTAGTVCLGLLRLHA